MKNNHFDIIVIGGGHAGIEAAWAASQYSSLNIAMVTSEGVPIGSTPCNPAIGGVGKGQLVREIDAMGGLMGVIADMSAIQCRRLNESKGYAVQSTRFQVDKDVYPATAERFLLTRRNLEIIRGSVSSVRLDKNGDYLVGFGDMELSCSSLVVTVGTFLDGKIHRGNHVKSGGRDDVDSSAAIDSIFESVKKLSCKFKTGTPARIYKDSIDYSVMEPQESDDTVECFHVPHGTKRFLPQVSCYKTRTTRETVETILDNKNLSPMFNGQIEGIGPRYCPSIEDKAFRYPDRYEHHVFVEPEGLAAQTVYPNGVSTSLPVDVQDEFLRSIKGFEDAKVSRYGYAVEYEVVDTTELDLTLRYVTCGNLYFAGQVNGTSGYEEAAGQGLVAGLNSALRLLGKPEIVFPRGTSYLGVLIDDVVGVRRDEPYRLFTARSENRLLLREDNALERMSKYRKLLNLNDGIDCCIDNHLYQKELLISIVESSRVYVSSETRQLSELLKDGKVDPVAILIKFLDENKIKFSRNVIKSVAIEVKYAGYLNKNNNSNKAIEKLSSKAIDWEKLSTCKSISNECRQRISKFKPKTFHQLKSVQGIRPATLSYVANGVL